MEEGAGVAAGHLPREVLGLAGTRRPFRETMIGA